MTVFSNWPTHSTPLSYVTALNISPQSHYIAIGNDKGKVLLYRYQNIVLFTFSHGYTSLISSWINLATTWCIVLAVFSVLLIVDPI